jgi:hypothetical protein
MANVVLEYRRLKWNDEYEPLYHYPNIELEQILARRECEFFVKNGVTYKQVSSAKEGNLFVIYVQIYEESAPDTEDSDAREGIKLEIRELNERQNHPLIQTYHFHHHLDVLSVIGSVYIYEQGKEWERDSAEIDEDRMVYILYVTPTGYEVEEEWS